MLIRYLPHLIKKECMSLFWVNILSCYTVIYIHGILKSAFSHPCNTKRKEKQESLI